MQELSIMRHAPKARPWLRAAMIVQQLYQRQQAADVLLPLPSLETAQKHHRRLRWCLDQRFPAAARYCLEALCDSLQSEGR